MPATLFKNRDDFLETLAECRPRHNDYKLSDSDPQSHPQRLERAGRKRRYLPRQKGKPEADSSLRDYEHVPLTEDVHDLFRAGSGAPCVRCLDQSTDVRDDKDRQIGKVGYEINFNRYFYQYQPPRPLDEINADIQQLEQEIIDMLREVTG